MQEKNCNFVPIAKDSSKREPIPYICGLRARIECEPLSEHSTRSDTFTNIRIGFFGFRLSIDYLEEVELLSLSCHFFLSTNRPSTNATIPTPIPV